MQVIYFVCLCQLDLFLFAGNCLKIPHLYPCATVLDYFFTYFLTFFWFLTIINAINLVDIMDGLAASISLCACISFACIGYFFKNITMVSWALIISGALISFLFYNKPHAKIYLGDAGSLMLGGVLSLIPFLITTGGSLYNYNNFLGGAIILGIPLMETLLLIVIRTYKKIPFYLGSQDHFVCFLRKKKWGDWKILFFVYVIALYLYFVAQMFFLKKISLIATFLQLSILLFFSFFTIYYKKCID